jgi:hypothetical protein
VRKNALGRLRAFSCGVPKDGIEIDVKRTVGLEQCSPRSVWSSPGFGLDWTAMNCIHILWVEGCRNAKKKKKKKNRNGQPLQSTAPNWTGQSRASPPKLPTGLDYAVGRLQSAVLDGPWGTL